MIDQTDCSETHKTIINVLGDTIFSLRGYNIYLCILHTICAVVYSTLEKIPI